MILYFSATGNTRFIASMLAQHLEDEALNLLPGIRSGDVSAIHSEKPFVICAPTYVCEMPRFLAAYLRRLPLTGSREVYFIFTSGGYAGISGVLARRLVEKKGMVYRGHAEFIMPRNYIANDTYPELDRAEIEHRIIRSANRLPAVAETIRRGGRLKARHVWLLETLITVPFNPVWCRIKQPTAPFQVGERCIACGLCARLCPLNAIQIIHGKPLWTKESCAHCMSCIQNCPEEAIEYGSITGRKQRYLFKKYRYVLEDGGGEAHEEPSGKRTAGPAGDQCGGTR